MMSTNKESTMTNDSAHQASEPAFRPGDRVRVSEALTRRPRVAGKAGKIGRPPAPISWPSYFRTKTTASGVRRIYWVDFDSERPTPGAVEGAEVDESDLSPA
jgi:hypothetical protein